MPCGPSNLHTIASYTRAEISGFSHVLSRMRYPAQVIPADQRPEDRNRNPRNPMLLVTRRCGDSRRGTAPTTKRRFGGATRLDLLFFVVYCVVFQHIFFLSTIRIMFYIDFGDFPKDLFYFRSNFVWQKKHVLVFFTFRELRYTKRIRL
jgi:hypothetical protein